MRYTMRTICMAVRAYLKLCECVDNFVFSTTNRFIVSHELGVDVGFERNAEPRLRVGGEARRKCEENALVCVIEVDGRRFLCALQSFGM